MVRTVTWSLGKQVQICPNAPVQHWVILALVILVLFLAIMLEHLASLGQSFWFPTSTSNWTMECGYDQCFSSPCNSKVHFSFSTWQLITDDDDDNEDEDEDDTNPVVWTCPWIPSRAHSATCAEVLTSLISPMCSSSQSQPSSLFHDDPGGAPTLIENMQHISVVSSASFLEMTWNATLHSLGVWTGVMYNQSFATKRSVLKAYGAYPWIEFQRCSMMFHYFHCASQPAAVQQDVGGFDVPVEGFWLWIVHVGEAWRTRERFSKRACQGIAM